MLTFGLGDSGLGIGTSHNGMMRHGVETHLVELDPMVYQYAKDYFHLLPNHTAHIMDAVKFVRDAAAVEKPEQWDFIIHDVFTGGAVPSVLFTTDIMQGMNKILKDDGVIAIVSFRYPHLRHGGVSMSPFQFTRHLSVLCLPPSNICFTSPNTELCR